MMERVGENFRRIIRRSVRLRQAAAPDFNSRFGYVEDISSGQILGWTRWKEDGTAPELAVVVGNERFILHPKWSERDDVLTIYPDAGATPGFSCRMPEACSVLIRDSDSAQPLSVVSENRVLKVNPKIQIESGQRRELHGADGVPSDFSAGLSSKIHDLVQRGLTITFEIEPFTDLDKAMLQIGGSGVAIYPTMGEKDGQKLAFADLPPLVWEHTDARGHCQISLSMAPEDRVRSGVVNSQEGLDFLERIRLSGASDEATVLLSIEHARVLSRRHKFSAPLREWLFNQAEAFRCRQFLVECFPQTDHSTKKADFAEMAPEMKRFFKAYHHVISNLTSWQGREHSLLEEACRANRLPPEQRFWMISSFIPEFCKRGQFDLLSIVVGRHEVDAMVQQSGAAELSLALPFLAAQRDVSGCVAILQRIDPAHGWVHTECIYAASERVASSNAPVHTNQSFFDAMVALVWRIGSDYWSRHYDAYLAAAFTCWIKRIDRLPMDLASHIVIESVKLYGLSRDFWDHLGEFETWSANGLILAQAHKRFKAIEAAALPDAGRDTLLKSASALAYFDRLGNVDQPQMRQEFALNVLRNHGDDETLLAALSFQSTQQDLVRFGAHPQSREDRNDATLRAAISSVGAHPTAHTGLTESQVCAQREAGHLLSALMRGEPRMPESVQQLCSLSRDLNLLSIDYLGADILTRALGQLNKQDEAFALMVELADSLVSEAISSSTRALHCQPILASLAALQHVPSSRFAASPGGADLIRTVTFLQPNASKGALQDLREILHLRPTSPEVNPIWPDVTVVVMTDQNTAEHNLAEIGSGWGRDLNERGITWRVAAPGAKNDDGHVVGLEVDFGPQSGPRSLIALLRWFLSETSHQYLAVFQPGCWISVDELFDSLSYRRHHYCGRVVTSSARDHSRVDHLDRFQSHGIEARLDRSPSRSSFCDLRGGVFLSRHAARKALEALGQSEGRWLLSVSFRTDKFLGDLIALKNIVPNDSGYLVHMEVPTEGGIGAVAAGYNSFRPGVLAKTGVYHAAPAAIEALQRNIDTPRLAPLKIWPTYCAAELRRNSNQLELLSEGEKLDALLGRDVIVVAVMRNEKVMLPHFLSHYRAIGAGGFIVVDNLSDDGTREALLREPDVVVYSTDTEYSASHYGVSWQQAVLANHCVGKWVVLVDADELLIYPGVGEKSLPTAIREWAGTRYDCIGTWLVDMYPKGSIEGCDFTKSRPFDTAIYHDEPPVRVLTGGGTFTNCRQAVSSSLRHRVMPSENLSLFMANKFPLIRYSPFCRLSEGIHFVGNVRIAPKTMWLAHFKYHAGFAAKVAEEVQRKQHFGGAIEYQRYSDFLSSGKGSFYRSGLSARLDPGMMPATS